MVKAIDDGGVAMYFQSTAKEESRHIVLSIEVFLPLNLADSDLGKKNETRKGK
jgi:hypothetical protein